MSDELGCVHQVLDQDAARLIWRKSKGPRSTVPFAEALGRSGCRVFGLVRAPLLALTLLALTPLALTPVALTPLLGLDAVATAAPGCLACHPGRGQGHPAGHAFAAGDCTACHAGDAGAETRELAHAGLVAFPGNLENAERTCGHCHPAQLAGVRASPMATLCGMVTGNRQAFGEVPAGDRRSAPAEAAGVASLGHSPADSLFRKLCASCHIAHPKARHALDPVRDRGGGCLACHLNGYPSGTHAEVSARVRDERCFGCHSRATRMALAYSGLAEVDESALARVDRTRLGRLPDGRLVERVPGDAHHRAGMRCVDCHRGTQLMGLAQKAGPTCGSCHAEGGRARMPAHPLAREHARLTCEACHSQWAPQCEGCHVRFEPGAEQWDHHEHRSTPGRWLADRGKMRPVLPALGERPDGRIAPLVPGMVMSAEYPPPDGGPATVRSWRELVPISPHTVGPARPCASCHGTPGATPPPPPAREAPVERSGPERVPVQLVGCVQDPDLSLLLDTGSAVTVLPHPHLQRMCGRNRALPLGEVSVELIHGGGAEARHYLLEGLRIGSCELPAVRALACASAHSHWKPVLGMDVLSRLQNLRIEVRPDGGELAFFCPPRPSDPTANCLLP